MIKRSAEKRDPLILYCACHIVIKYYLLVKVEDPARACPFAEKPPSLSVRHFVLFLISSLNTAKARRRITDAPATPVTPATVDNFGETDVRLGYFLKFHH